MSSDIPKIKKVADIGEAPFRFVEKLESILQGWDKTIGKTIYLFRTDNDQWGYYDKDTEQIIEVTQWKNKSAWINDHWVLMSLYHRVHVAFEQPVSYSGWDSSSRRKVTETASEAILTITNTAFRSLEEQMQGRDPNSFYKFSYANKKIKGRNVGYVDKVVWVK